MLNLQGPVQYDEDIGDVSLPTKSSEKGMMEKILDDLKSPLIATLIFVLLTQPFIRDNIIKVIPKIQDSAALQTLALSFIFLTLNYLAKKLIDIES